MSRREQLDRYAEAISKQCAICRCYGLASLALGEAQPASKAVYIKGACCSDFCCKAPSPKCNQRPVCWLLHIVLWHTSAQLVRTTATTSRRSCMHRRSLHVPRHTGSVSAMNH